MPKLTKTYVDRLRPRERRYEVGCSALQGFVIRVNVDGSKTAVVRYFRDGRARRLKLGRIGEHFPVDRARTEAGRILRAVERGEDPARDRERLRHAPTFAYVAERYLAEVGRPYRKASTVRNYEAMLRNHLASTLGPMRVEAIERTDVLRLHQEIGREAPGAANRVAAFVSVVMTHAETWGYRPMRTNPCYKIPKFKGRKMERFLDPEERARLDEVLCEGEAAPLGHPNHLGPSTVAAIRLLLLTGARRGEITALEWSMVDLERACLRLPDSKTGAKVIPLSPPAVAVLRELRTARREDERYVCPCKAGDGPLQNLNGSWVRIRERAGLDGVRLHDLRHSAASDMLAAGLSLAEIAVILVHKSTQTTQRYAHASDEAQRSIARRFGEAVERSTREGAERLRQQRAVGEDRETSVGADVTPIDGGKVIRFPGKRRR
ncbi:MAG: tyrosine-type recombinase/integrase [Myxococcales bacterium]|nr:tyrosine-type recombinase/integrase [Myxococcales bacterium]